MTSNILITTLNIIQVAEPNKPSMLKLHREQHQNLVYFQYRCVGSVMFQHDNLTTATWLSRDGTPQIYWGGATSRRDRYCACGETSEFLSQKIKH